jgi:basic membrane protein A
MNRLLLLGLLLPFAACKPSAPAAGTAPAAAPAATTLTVGLVTDVGGRGDQSFNDGALRGLEAWAGGARFVGGKYERLSEADRAATIPAALRATVTPVAVRPLVVQSKMQEDYQPNLQLLVDQGAGLTIGVGFLLENALETVARANPGSRFLLIDSPLMDAAGKPYTLPNVRTVVYREEEGAFLVGALAGLVATEAVGFVGGMKLPLIEKFEAGFRAGVRSVNPRVKVLVQYTGSFDNVSAGKAAGADLLAKGCQVVFHGAGIDGVGVIQAVKEAHDAGKRVYAVGVDSDQSALAPEAMLTSMLKRVDLAVWEAVHDVATSQFQGGDRRLGLKEGGLALAEVKLDLPDKASVLAKVDALAARLISGELKAPSTLAELEAATPR